MRALVMIVALAAAVAAQCDERIESYRSDLEVLADGSMEVVETITVNAEGKEIRRGIYRDFPTVYRDRANNRVTVRFEVVGVRRDGEPENWFTKSLSNGVRVYAGKEDVRIPAGRHTYEFTYRTDRQLGYFAQHDELYWNVTGNDWAFPIDEVIAFVHLPRTVPADRVGVEAYTGPAGARGRDYEAGVDEEGVAWFRSTRTLAPGEGLTLVTTWPKGYVREPSARQKVDWFLEDNAHVLAGMIGVLLLLGYYGVAWMLVGRDPAAGVVFARYEPPAGYSPAAMRFVRRMGYDDKCFTAALVNLAVNGHVRIEDDDGDFEVAATGGGGALAPGEKALRDRLLAGGRIVLERVNHERIRKAIDAHRTRLEADYEKRYFVTNLLPTLFGFALSLLVLIVAVIWSAGGEELIGAAFMLVWLGGWTFGTLALLTKVLAAWRAARGGSGYGAAIVLSLFSAPFVGGWFMGAGMLGMLAGWATVALLACLMGVNFLFYHLMKAPTALGRRLLDEVEGFHEYLAVAEADELRLVNPPRKTPELFERFLPYAIALDVEDVWGRRFEQVIARASRESGYAGPAWYRGHRSFSASGFTSSVGSSLASSVSSSSQAPGSSSGSGGGGSSGGGGGGGGGGGW